MSEEVVKSLLYKDIVLIKKGSGIGVKNDIWLSKLPDDISEKIIDNKSYDVR